MGYLDDLRKRAAALEGQQREDVEAIERNIIAVEDVCKGCFHYWLDLARQLNVLRPAVPTRYVFDARHALEPADELRFDEFQVDSRLKALRNLEVRDHVVIACWARSGRKLSIAKDFPPDAERLEARLAQAGIHPVLETVRDAQSGHFIETRYEFHADVRVAVRLTPDHERGRVQFEATNVEGLKSLTLEFAAGDVDEPLLDELSKWWLGEPSRFVASGRIARIVEPR
jgi:hypothetical protein